MEPFKLSSLPTSPTSSITSLSSISTSSFPYTPNSPTHPDIKTTLFDSGNDESDDNDTLTIMTPRNNKANIVKSFSNLYSKPKSPQLKHEKLSSATQFLRGLQSSNSSTQSSESCATVATLSHQNSLMALSERKNLSSDFASSIPKRKKKMSEIFVRLSSPTVSAKTKIENKSSSELVFSIPESQIPKLTNENLAFKRHQRSLNRSISTPVLNLNQKSPSSSNHPVSSNLPRKSSKRFIFDYANSPTHSKIFSMQPNSFSVGKMESTPTESSDKFINTSQKVRNQASTPFINFSGKKSKTDDSKEIFVLSPPLSPLSSSPTMRRRSASLQSTPAYSVKATPRMKTHNRSRTSISSMSSYTSSSSSTRRPSINVEQLKSKINELQQVLEQEQSDRAFADSFVERVRFLEGELAKERNERIKLLTKLRVYENSRNKPESMISITSIDSSLSGGFSSSCEEDLYSDDSHNSLKQQMTYLENQLAKKDAKLKEVNEELVQERKKSEEKILNSQKEITELKLLHEGLKTNNDALKMHIQTLIDRLSKAEAITKQTDKQLSRRQSKLELTTSKLAELESTIKSLNQDITDKVESKNAEIKNLTMRLAQYQKQSRQLTDKIKHLLTGNQIFQQRIQTLEVERNEMVKSTYKYQKQVSALDREYRCAVKHITSLETSLQDLKISLEEKAMENDELNRSIQKVMEQANDTIKVAKRRHSLRNTNGGNFDSSTTSLASLIE